MIMNICPWGGDDLVAEREIAPGVLLRFTKWSDGRKSLYTVLDKDVIVNIDSYAVTDHYGCISGVWKNGYSFNELAGIKAQSLRYEIDGDKLLLYCPMSKLRTIIKRNGVTYSRKLAIGEKANE